MWLESALISKNGIFNVMEKMKVRCYIVLFEKKLFN